MNKETDSKEDIHIGKSKVELPEIGFVIVAIGLSTIAIASGHGSLYVLIKIFSVVIYIMAMWGAFIFYWHILHEKIPATMAIWQSKKGRAFSLKGPLWIFTRWLKLTFYTGISLNKKKLEDTLECGYLTILLALFLYWFAGLALYMKIFIDFINK